MTIKKTTSSTGLQVSNAALSRPATPAPADSPEAKVTLQSKPASRSPAKWSIRQFFAARRSVDLGVLNRANADKSSSGPKGGQFNLDETLFEMGFHYVGDKKSRSEWDAKARSGRASDKTEGEPRQRAESRGQALPTPNAPTARPPLHQVAIDKTQGKPGQPAKFAARPPLVDKPPPLPSPGQTEIPEKAANKTPSKPGQPADFGALNQPLPNDLPALPSPAPALKLRPLPPPLEHRLSKLLSPLADKAPVSDLEALPPGHLPPQPSIIVKPSSQPQSLLPADVPVNNALKFLELTLPNEQSEKTESVFSRLTAALNNATDPMGYEAKVTAAKVGVRKAESTLKSAGKGDAKTAKSDLADAQIRLSAAETRCKDCAKYLQEFTAGRLDAVTVKSEVKQAQQRVDQLEARVRDYQAAAKKGTPGATNALELVNRQLDDARAELQYAEAQQEIFNHADEAGINAKWWKEKILDTIPEGLHGLMHVLAKMNSVVYDRYEWVKSVSKYLPENGAQRLRDVLVAGGQMTPKIIVMMKELAEHVTQGNEAKVKGLQAEFQTYLGKDGSLHKTIDQAIAVLNAPPSDPKAQAEALALRADLQDLLKALGDPEGIAQLIRIGEADTKQVMKLGVQLWVPPPADLPPPLPPQMLPPQTT